MKTTFPKNKKISDKLFLEESKEQKRRNNKIDALITMYKRGMETKKLKNKNNENLRELKKKNVNIASFRPKVSHKNNTLENLTVKIMEIPKIEQPKQKLMPTKITVNSDILIGKRLQKDIIGKNNELIIKQNQVLTTKHILIAKQHDKLNELFYSVY